MLLKGHFRRRCEQQLGVLRKQLGKSESGRIYVGERRPGAGWVDVTQREIRRTKKTIGIYESFLASSSPATADPGPTS
jgi:hypothetical protein